MDVLLAPFSAWLTFNLGMVKPSSPSSNFALHRHSDRCSIIPIKIILSVNIGSSSGMCTNLAEAEGVNCTCFERLAADEDQQGESSG